MVYHGKPWNLLLCRPKLIQVLHGLKWGLRGVRIVNGSSGIGLVLGPHTPTLQQHRIPTWPKIRCSPLGGSTLVGGEYAGRVRE